MSWIAAGNDLQGVMEQLPVIGERFHRLSESFWQQSHIPQDVLELCRLRLAQLHRSHSDWELRKQPVAEDKISNLRRWDSHATFSEGERACLAMTEVHAMDAQAITDEQAEAVRQHYGDQGLVALIQALGVFDGLIRLGLVWGLSETSTEEAG